MSEPAEAAIETARRMFDLAREGDHALLGYLKQGVPVGLTDARANSLLMLASYHGHAALAAGLIDAGAVVDALNDRGQTPLAGAISKDFADVAQVLLERGADLDTGSPSAREIAQLVQFDIAALGLASAALTRTDHNRTPAPIDGGTFRRVLGNFASGVVVVTAAFDGAPVGMTAQSFMALSLDPALVMFCPAHISTSWPKIRQAGHFAANILADGQQHLASQFAKSGIDKFADVDWRAGPSGAPLISGCLAHIDCTIEAVHDGGDHHIVVGRVLHLAAEPDKQPLVFFRSAFGHLSPAEPPVHR